MSEDRKVSIKDMRGTKGCSDLFCNVSLYSNSSGREHTTIIGLSKGEAKDIYILIGSLLQKVGELK